MKSRRLYKFKEVGPVERGGLRVTRTVWLTPSGLRVHVGCKQGEEQQGVRTEVPLGLRLEG